MADESQRPIHIKKIKKASHGHHGGAWKIAYADFITAMMAFFLLLWLLSSVSQGTLNGVSEYFKTPLRVALMGGKSAADASSPIKGGGQDLTRQDGQRKKTEEMDERQKEKVLLAKLQARIKEAIEKNKILNQYKNQLLLEMTPEGLRIQIIDEKNRPMFDSGSSRLLPHTKDLLQELGRQLNEVQNRLSISGHTDAAPYSAGDKGFSNWELSSDRANAARRELVVGGMQDSRLLRVVGQGSATLLDRVFPNNPINRRISIVILNKETEAAILRESGTTETVYAPHTTE
jgi:chemotaxis protein MotB